MRTKKLTFPATTPLIEAAKVSHGLTELLSSEPGTEVRHVFVMPEVTAFLDNPPANFVPLQFSYVHEKFVRNQIVVASVAGTSNKRVAFERLTDVFEVWILCVRRPYDGQYRFFGRFVEPGVFVVMQVKSRAECGGGAYAACIEEFEAKWLAVFGDHNSLTGDTCEAFFGEMVSDIDAE